MKCKKNLTGNPGLDRVVELLLPVLATLQDISLNKDGDGVIGAGNWNFTSRDDA